MTADGDDIPELTDAQKIRWRAAESDIAAMSEALNNPQDSTAPEWPIGSPAPNRRNSSIPVLAESCFAPRRLVRRRRFTHIDSHNSTRNSESAA